MEEIKITLERIMELSKAVDIVSLIDDLPLEKGYWIGRLGDFCSGPIKRFNKDREKLQRTGKVKQKPFIDEYQLLEKKDSKEGQLLLDKISEINEQLNDKLNDLKEVADSIKMPAFVMNDFMAVEDVVRVYDVQEKNEKGDNITKRIEIKIKKGQSLVPIGFFKLMGEYIKQ